MHLAAGYNQTNWGSLQCSPRSPCERDGTRGIGRERDRGRVGGEVE